MSIMRSINNKYLIESEISDEENYCKYIVIEFDTNKKYVLTILKNNFTYEKTREYLLNKFKTIKNLNCENIVNLLDFQIIYNMDGIKLEKYQYGYLMEYIDVHIDVQNYIETCTLNEKLDLFMELCSIVNTLNSKGYIFKNIKLNDVLLFLGEDNIIHVKINNILQNEISKLSLINISRTELPYPYNIENSDYLTSVKDNIVEIIELFGEIFTEEELESDLKALKDIMKRFNQIQTINKLYNLNYFIKFVNNRMNLNYKYFYSESLNIIQDDIDIIGREEELKIVEKNYKSILDNRMKYKIIGFKGDSGSGKTRLLKEIKYILKNKYFKTIFYIDDLIVENNQKTYENILEYIKNKCDKQLYYKYYIYIKKFISLCLGNDTDNTLLYDKNQQLQLVNRVGKFIREYTSSNPLVLIIDNLERKSKIFKEFIRYISFLRNSLENVMIVFSLNDVDCDNDFLQYIKELKTLDQYEEYKIDFLNQYDTTKMIKNVLNTNKPIGKLGNKIYSETLGNPQYIREVVYEIYNNNILYYNEEKGTWKTRIDVKDILIPKILEQELETSIYSLNEEEIDVLRLLSIYETPLPEKIILTNIITDMSNIHIYKKLKLNGYLIDKISDQGMLVGFSNNLVRNILYLRLDKSKKEKMHRQAYKILEQTLSSTDYYMEEMLFHMEESKDFELLCMYSIDYAQKLESCENYEKAKEYYKKVLKYSKDNRINLTINIAKIYEKTSNNEKSCEYFEKVKKYAIEENNVKIKIYAMLEMIIKKLNFSVDISQEIDKTLLSIREQLDKINEPICEAYYNYALALKYRMQFNNNMSIYSAKKGLDICEKNNINDDIYPWLMITLADVYLKKSKYDDAKNLCSKSIELFLKSKNNNGIIISKITTTFINLEQGQPYNDVLRDYQEIERLSNKFKLYKSTIIILILTSQLYVNEEKYFEAEKSLLKALSIEREEGINIYSMNICANLCILYLSIGKIDYFIKYYTLIKQLQRVAPLVEDDIYNINITDALYNMIICSNIKAFECLSIINKSNYSHYYKTIICLSYELKLFTCNNIDDIKKVYNILVVKLQELNSNKIRLNIKLSAIKIILDLGYYEFAKKAFYEVKEYPKDYDTEGTYIFLKFKFGNKNSYNFLINKALKLCSVIDNKKICADLYGIIGEKYEELGYDILALNNFYESISLHTDIINLLFEKDKITYINNSGFLKIRNQLTICLRKNLRSRLKYMEFEKVNNFEELNLIFKEINIKNILSDKYIYDLIQKNYERCCHNDLNSIYRVLNSFSSDIVENIKLVLKYMARITLADKAIFFVENSDGENNILCTYRINDKNETDRFLSLKLDSKEDAVVISNHENRFDQIDNEILKDGIKACMYMKLRNREKHINVESTVNGELILIATNAVNNINSESKNIIEKFKPFLTFLLEKYSLTINSTLDKLTSVYNRKYLEESLGFLIEGSYMDNREFAVIMFDIDDFKGINDKYGHQVGDEVLVKLTKVVKNNIRKNDIIGRYGGEEFVILLPNLDKNKAVNIAERIRDNVEEARILGEKRKVTISIGITMSNSERISREELIGRADQALYKAKHEGKNRCILWSGNYGINNSTNTINELSGVITGNATRDYNFISIIKEISSIVKNKGDKEKKMYEFTLKIMHIIECDSVTLFIVNNKKVVDTLSKYRFKDGWNVSEKFNFSLVENTIKNKKGSYKVDWDNIDRHDEFNIPDWKSVCITPVICDEEVLALIYISVSVNKKEFGEADLNQLNLLAEIGTPIFE